MFSLMSYYLFLFMTLVIKPFQEMYALFAVLKQIKPNQKVTSSFFPEGQLTLATRYKQGEALVSDPGDMKGPHYKYTLYTTQWSIDMGDMQSSIDWKHGPQPHLHVGLLASVLLLYVWLFAVYQAHICGQKNVCGYKNEQM